MRKKILVSITGASGSLYGIRLLEALHACAVETHLIISDGAKRILEYETSFSTEDIVKKTQYYYNDTDLHAGPASGSFHLDGMCVVPCSMKTLSAIANGFCNTLTTRAACCTLKENRTLVLTPRETPLDLPGLKNMVAAREAGAVVLPAMPGFYHQPDSLNDILDFIVGKILDQFSIDHSLFKRWA